MTPANNYLIGVTKMQILANPGKSMVYTVRDFDSSSKFMANKAIPDPIPWIITKGKLFSAGVEL